MVTNFIPAAARAAGYALAAVLTVSVAAPALADYPERPIRLVIPFGQGGATDSVGRMIAAPLEEALGVSVAVVNQPGAAGAVGLANVAQARPDGYTLAIGSDSSIAARPLMTESGYTAESFAPIARLVEAPIGFAVRADSPYETLDDLVEAMRAGDLLWSSPGTGSGPFLAAETFFAQFDLDATHINAASAGEAIVKLLSGEVAFVSAAGSNFPAMLDENEGLIRVLALASEERWPILPEVPTYSELGYDFVRGLWFGIVAPAGTPEDVLARLSDEIETILTAEGSAELLARFNFSNGFQNPERFSRQIASESESLAPVLEEIGMARSD